MAKKKKCTGCDKYFESFEIDNGLSKFCTKDCAFDYISKNKNKLVKDGEKKKRKIYDEETRKRKRAMLDTDKKHWRKKAQTAFNAFIRERDKDLPCISCGRFHSGSYDAGHYRSVGAARHLAFNEMNCHRQCVPCNQHKSGNAIEYRINLVRKIGVEAVEMLENDNDVVRHTLEDYKRIYRIYTDKLKELAAD